jgi:hypothetical protein
MRRAIAVQAPFWLGAAWGAIKGVMPASVTVDLLSASKTMEGGLKEYIDEAQIPVEYGGKSNFKLGQHPFEIGLDKLVDTQPTDVIEDDEFSVSDMNADLPEEDPRTLFDDQPEILPQRPQKVHFKQDQPPGYNAPNFHVIEWDDLDADYVLMVATILFFLSHMLIGAIELVLPILFIIPPKQGIGFEARRVGMTSFAACMAILWIMKRTRLSSKIIAITEKSPLSAFRIGLGASSFFWIGITFVLSITPPYSSALGVLCLILYLSLVFFSSTLGITSVSHLRQISILGFANGSHTLPKWCSWIQHDSNTPRLIFFSRATGILLAAPVIRWYIAIPINGLCFIVLACVCGFLYVVSFALHSVTPPPPPVATRRRRKVSQFVTAMSGLWWFIKDLLLVALGDSKFVWKELTGKVQDK